MAIHIAGAVIMFAGMGLLVFSFRLARLFGEDKAKLVNRILIVAAFTLIIVGGAMMYEGPALLG